MAFVSRSERKLQNEDYSSVGPGAYLNQNEYKPVSSFAPFSSTSERDINKIFCKGFTPGPGSYIQDHSNLVGVEASQAKFSSAFASQINRFKPNQFDEVPGPGSYTVPDAWMQQKKKGQIEKITDWTGPFTAPSIPSTRQNNGYEVTDTGALLMNKPIGEYYAGTKSDSVGPGHYYVTEAKNNNGPKWHKAKNSRNLYTFPTTTAEIGPGSYMKEKPRVKPLYKVKESAAFSKSKSVEKIKPPENPGPGHYPVDKYSSFNKKKIPNSLQNFGSSSSRFVEKRVVAKIGPGYYDSKAKAESSRTADSKIPFSSSDVRFQYKYNNIPGPGAYQDIDRIEAQESRISMAHGPFGSTSMRFLSDKHKETPGPGQY